MNQENQKINPDDQSLAPLTEFFSATEMEGIEPLTDGDALFFPAIECAKRLGYKNPRDAIRQHCEHEAKIVDQIVVTGKRKDGSDAVQVVHKKYICEGDFYRLVFHSRLPLGKQFAEWVTEEVLPMIRRYGFYPGRDFLRSLQAYNDALDECIKATHDWENMREISDELQKQLDKLNAAFPMQGAPKENAVDLPAQDTPRRKS